MRGGVLCILMCSEYEPMRLPLEARRIDLPDAFCVLAFFAFCMDMMASENTTFVANHDGSSLFDSWCYVWIDCQDRS